MRIVLSLVLVFVFANAHGQVAPDTTKPKSSVEKKRQNVLIVINGVVQSKRGVQNLDSTMLNPDQIETITFLKEKTAIELYGDKGKDGVIEIVTKKREPRTPKLRLEEFRAEEDSSMVFTKVEIEPAFKGGESAWKNFLMKNLNANVPVENGAPEGTYTVVLQFIVTHEGAITDVKALTNHGFGMEEECIRIMKLSSWLPGIQNGRHVRAYKKQPITFVVAAE